MEKKTVYTIMGEEPPEAAVSLAPCPFCGGQPPKLQFSEGSTFRWIVASCAYCGATAGETRVQTLGNGTPEEWRAAAERDAVEQWNRRAVLAKAQP